MNADTIVPIFVLSLTLLVNTLLGAIVFMRAPKVRLNQVFFLLAIAAGLWVLTNLLFSIAEDRYLLAFASYASAAILVLFFLLYCIELDVARYRERKKVLLAVAVIGVLMTIFSAWPGVLASEVTPAGKIITNSVPLVIYGVYVASYIVIGITLLIRARLRANTEHEKEKLYIVFFGLSFAAAIGLVLNLILPMMENYDYVQFGPVATLIFVATSTYAIVRHGLFDIKLAVVRSVAYIMVLGVLAGIYYFLAYLVSITLFKSETSTAVSISPANIFLALILAFMFQPIKKFFDRLTDSIFYRDMYKSDDFFARMSELLGSTTNLHGLLERASREIASTLKSEQAFFFLYYDNGTRHHMSAGTARHAKLPVLDVRTLDAFVESGNTGVTVTDALPQHSGVRRMLVSHRVALVMPLRYSGQLIGYVLLGEQQRSGGYTKRDLKVLGTVADELVIAIQHALSVHAIKEINANLQQRIDVATKELRSSNAQLRHLDEVKDEFISMASHQLRTPLTSVKGYISMVLEGDIGKITPQQDKVLTEAFNSSERMVRLIGDFLNVSRLQTGKFVIERVPVDIVPVIQGEVTSLQLIADSHNLTLAFAAHEESLVLPIDEAKIRQVIMNLIDNAIYYSRQSSTITVNLQREGDMISFTVTDTGIGVPESEQPMLFNKFFRAKNARQQRPDGTGVGLYLAKKVVTAHDGKMIFSSKEGQGSTFGFKLPLEASRKSDRFKD